MASYKTLKTCGDYSLRYTFHADNTGAAFARNYNGSVRINIVHWPDDVYTEILNIKVGSVPNLRVADKVARTYVRENKLREKLEKIAAGEKYETL